MRTPSVRAPALLLVALFATACPPEQVVEFVQCDLDLELEVESATPGTEVTAGGRPLTQALDTIVRVDGVEAEVVSVDRSEIGCLACDECYVSAGCTGCEECAACADACGDCVQSVTFQVPESTAAGTAEVTVINAYGTSPPLPLDIVVDDET